MATTKKSTKATKRSSTTTAKKKPAKATKSVAKRAPSKSVSATKVRRSTAPKTKSFRKAEPEHPFLSFKITTQTFYWVVLGGFILALGIWVLTLHNQVQELYDEIDRNQAAGLEILRKM